MNSLGGRDLLRRVERRANSICDTTSQVRDLLNQIYTGTFSCSCNTSGSASTFTCTSNGALKCGDISARVSHVLYFEINSPQSEVVCHTFTSGVGDWNGKAKCITALYTGSTASSCTASVGDSACSSCSPCGQLYGTQVEWMSIDCSNIPHNIPEDKSVIVKNTCSDLNDPEKMKQLVCNGSSSLVGYFTATITTLVIAYIGFS